MDKTPPRVHSRSSVPCRNPHGFAAWPLVLAIGIVVLIGGWWLMASSPKTGEHSAQPLTIICAASNQVVLEAIRRDYEQEYGVPLHVQYGPSQTLLAGLQVSKSGDIYLPADDSYLTLARERGLTAEKFPLARMQAVVTVPKGNPKGIKTWDDLMREDIRIAQASPDGTAIGKMTRDVLTEAGLWDLLHERTLVYKTTVHEVANDVKVGAADAGIVFDAVVHGYETLEAVSLLELERARADITAAVLTTSRHSRQALHFARYMSARDKGLVRYREHGFVPVEGDVWDDKPEITLYAGSMLRPAIEQVIADFEAREGVSVLRVYNGCGVLVAQVKAGQVPDAYFACDVEFMNQVKELFPDAEDISQNELVILVAKGNPLDITSLSDLTRPNLRVGIGHEKQCAMGWLTQRTFREGGVQAGAMKNVVVQTPTGDMLVNQMRAGSLDAAVAYLSNAAGSADSLEAIRIQGLPCSIATQPFAVAKDSHHKQLTERLLQAIRTAQSRQRFESEGFRWIDDANGERS